MKTGPLAKECSTLCSVARTDVLEKAIRSWTPLRHDPIAFYRVGSASKKRFWSRPRYRWYHLCMFEDFPEGFQIILICLENFCGRMVYVLPSKLGHRSVVRETYPIKPFKILDAGHIRGPMSVDLLWISRKPFKTLQFLPYSFQLSHCISSLVTSPWLDDKLFRRICRHFCWKQQKISSIRKTYRKGPTGSVKKKKMNVSWERNEMV